MQNSIPASFEAALGIPDWAGYVLVFVIGACIGSFLNVVIYRVPNELSLLTGSASAGGTASASVDGATRGAVAQAASSDVLASRMVKRRTKFDMEGFPGLISRKPSRGEE